jgi:Zn-dependent protease
VEAGYAKIKIIYYLILFGMFIFSLTLHEVAHAIAAYWMGDPTAKYERRITFNPLAHIDPFGTILLPLFLMLAGAPVVMGWAKPVPFNPLYFRNFKKGIMIVGLSGPLMNIIIAVVAGGLSLLLHGVTKELLIHLCILNVVLAVFNLVPVPPLDGSRIVTGFLPDRVIPEYLSIEPFGFIAIYILLYAGVLDYIITPVIKTVISLLTREPGV